MKTEIEIAKKYLTERGYEIKEPKAIIPEGAWCIFSDIEIPTERAGILAKFKEISGNNYITVSVYTNEQLLEKFKIEQL